ncbi:PREDICTED: iroquois-class homeodomain protein IRX-4 [Bison bison bison]|uniref:Iroquois-class homeodomain protein IRX-4 n=1 Tax=Bison bison bison TaxID=43346 RepID=A0A6P3IV54_BISBB|nr:PREDICTED: iroquois-class homeodomain protein IRX-4 [Bison bison bison]
MSYPQFGYPYSSAPQFLMTTNSLSTCCESGGRTLADSGPAASAQAPVYCPVYESRLLATARHELNSAAALGVYGGPYGGSQGYGNYVTYGSEASAFYSLYAEGEEEEGGEEEGRGQPLKSTKAEEPIGKGKDLELSDLEDFDPLEGEPPECELKPPFQPLDGGLDRIPTGPEGPSAPGKEAPGALRLPLAAGGGAALDQDLERARSCLRSAQRKGGPPDRSLRGCSSRIVLRAGRCWDAAAGGGWGVRVPPKVSAQVTRRQRPALGDSPAEPQGTTGLCPRSPEPAVCGRLLTFAGSASHGGPLCIATNSDWTVPGPTRPTRGDELAGPPGPVLQGGWIPLDHDGHSGRTQLQAPRCHGVVSRELSQGDVRAQPSCAGAAAPTEKKVYCWDQPGRGSLSETRLALGAGLKSPPAVFRGV